jgi:hypothetical protein
LVQNEEIDLKDWFPALRSAYPGAQIEHCPIIARLEGQGEDELNRLTVETDSARLEIVDRPTTVDEYEPGDLDNLVQRIGMPKKFFAISYTSIALLADVLRVIARVATGRLYVETEEQGELFSLDDFIDQQTSQ